MSNYLKLLMLCLCMCFAFACAKKHELSAENDIAPVLNYEQHLTDGLNHEQNGEWEAAIEEYKIAAVLSPYGDFYVANLYFQLNRLEEAEKHYRIAIQHILDSPALYNNLAWLLYTRQGNLEEAEKLAKDAVRLASPAHLAEYEDTLSQIQELSEMR